MLTHVSAEAQNSITVYGFGGGFLWCLTWPSLVVLDYHRTMFKKDNSWDVGCSGRWPLPWPAVAGAPVSALTLTQGFWGRPTIFLLNATHAELLEDVTCECYRLSLHIIFKVVFHPVLSGIHLQQSNRRSSFITFLLVEKTCDLSWQILCRVKQSLVAERRFVNKVV